MSDELYRQKCTACRRDSPHVTEDEVARFRPEIPDWELIEDAGIPKLDRAYKFRNFQQALDFTAAIGEMAESEGHHPKLVTEWGRVGVTWWTHKDPQPAPERLHHGGQDGPGLSAAPGRTRPGLSRTAPLDKPAPAQAEVA